VSLARRTISLCLAGAVLGTVPTAHALPPADSSAGAEPAPETAETLLRRGVELRRQHRNEEALAAFRRALATSPSPIARAQIALAEQALGQWLEADSDLAAVLGGPDDPWIAKNRGALEEARTEIARHLGWLTVDVEPAAANVSIDGKPAAPGTEVRTKAGEMLVEASAPGHVVSSRRVEVQPNAHVRVVLTLAAAVEPAQSAAPPPVPVLEKPPAVEAPPRPFPTGPAVVAGAGVLALGAGTYFGLRAISSKNTADAECIAGSCGPSGIAQSNDARSWATASTIAMGTGLGLVLGGAAWWNHEARAGAGGASGASTDGAWAGPLVLSVAALTSFGAGTYLGLHSLDQTRARNDECAGGPCTPAGLEDGAGARSSELGSAAALGAGALMTAGAAVWWILDSTRGGESQRPSAGGPVLVALGVSALGAASYFGARVYSEKSARDGSCSHGECAPEALTHDADARTSASLATVGFGAAAALVGTGTALWLSDPSRSRRTTGAGPSAHLGAGFGSLSLEGELP
jgi:serine/threonine-protein kinase